MRKFVLSLALLLTLPLTAAAQSHPCDTPPTLSPTLAGQVKAQFCWDGKDADGNPTSLPLTRVKLFFDGATTPAQTLVPVVVTPTANAAGFKLYETPFFTMAVGPHTVVAALVNSSGTGGQSTPPFPFVVVDGLPSLPSNLRIAK
jgi:hypothetical protein